MLLLRELLLFWTVFVSLVTVSLVIVTMKLFPSATESYLGFAIEFFSLLTSFAGEKCLRNSFTSAFADNLFISLIDCASRKFMDA